MSHTPKTGIIFCNEKGLLEQQSLLLVESLKKFQPLTDITLFSCSPRADFAPSKQTLSQLQEQQVVVIKENLNHSFGEYPIANKMIASAFVEKNFKLDNLIFVDSDTVFLNPICPQRLKQAPSLQLRPVDNQGPGSTGKDDKNDPFWQQIFALFDLKPPPPTITTTVRTTTIRPYFNAGLVWVNQINGFFQQWLADFTTIANSNLRPSGYQSKDQDNFRCLDQVALAVTAHRHSQQLSILPPTYNYPIPFRPLLNQRQPTPMQQLIHIHYHKWFQHPNFLDHISTKTDQTTPQYQWLKQKLPLKPTINSAFKV